MIAGKPVLSLRRCLLAGVLLALLVGWLPVIAQEYFSQDIPASVTITVGMPADVNGDDTVDILDLVLVAGSFGLRSGAPGFEAAADITGDELVNIFDLATVGLNFGRSYQP